jgi:hypothetical protein
LGQQTGDILTGFDVNTYTGNLIIQKEVASIPGRGPALSEVITYNSLSSVENGLGQGWVLGNDLHHQENTDDSIDIRDADGTNHKMRIRTQFPQ